MIISFPKCVNSLLTECSVTKFSKKIKKPNTKHKSVSIVKKKNRCFFLEIRFNYIKFTLYYFYGWKPDANASKDWSLCAWISKVSEIVIGLIIYWKDICLIKSNLLYISWKTFSSHIMQPTLYTNDRMQYGHQYHQQNDLDLTYWIQHLLVYII